MSAPVRVFLSGEGRNELGSRLSDPAYATEDHKGVLQVLLERVREQGWEVVGFCQWSRVRSYKAGKGDPEAKRIMAITLDAKENQADILAFSRDSDADARRERAIEEGIEKARTELRDPPSIVGGAAVPALEGWLLAMKGVHGTEGLRTSRAVDELEKQGVPPKHGPTMVEVVVQADLTKLPKNAASLKLWLKRAEDAFTKHGL